MEITCIKCKHPVERERFNNPVLTRCSSCGSDIMAFVFPAFFRETETGQAGEVILTEEEAGCFFHPKKKAILSCSACGRFLCALCDLKIEDRHICPSCLESESKKKKIRNLENHRTLYDDMALSLSIIPMLFCFPVIFTAPATIYFVVRHWKSPGSILPRTRIRFVLAFIFALISIIFISVWFTFADRF